MKVDITLPVYDGARFIEAQVESIRAQTHRDWRLWVRDDGSTDGTWEKLKRLAAMEPRINLHPRDGARLGVAMSNGWLYERLPGDVRYLCTSDADDVWRKDKIARSLDAMFEAESRNGPVLVHTDLEVVDQHLHPIAPSFWRYTGVAPEPTDLGRLLVSNVATGPTMLLNRPLLRKALPIPREAAFHDWWIALVAYSFGRIVAVPEPTVRYRRHGANASGRLSGPLRGVGDAVRRTLAARSRTATVRDWIDATGRQAGAFLLRYGSELPPDQVESLRAIASVRARRRLERRREVFRHYTRPERGWLRNLGLLARA